MTILVASDLSARSDRALARSFALARELASQLRVLHVVNADLPEELRMHSIEWAQQALARETEVLEASTGVRASLEVRAGYPKTDIIARAQVTGATLIVLGTHNVSVPLSRSFSETTAGQVLKSSHLPVLLVKEDATQPYRRVVVGVDFSMFSRAAVRQSFRIAPAAHFTLVHGYRVPFKAFLAGQSVADDVGYRRRLELDAFLEEEMELLSRQAYDLGIAPLALEKILREGAPRDVLHAECSRIAADLVVIGTHGRTGIPRAMRGSIAADLLDTPPCDVLVALPYQ